MSDLILKSYKLHDPGVLTLTTDVLDLYSKVKLSILRTHLRGIVLRFTRAVSTTALGRGNIWRNRTNWVTHLSIKIGVECYPISDLNMFRNFIFRDVRKF